MIDGNRSLWIMYVSSVVWYAPAVAARRTSMALCRTSKWAPLRIIPSSVPTKSVKIVSM